MLLVILGMLAALALLGIAFVMFSSEEERASGNYARQFQASRGDYDVNAAFTEALGQIVADTNNRFSVVRSHSLLRDEYGNDSDVNPATGVPPGNGQLDPAEYHQRQFNGPGEAGPDGIVGTADDADVNYVFNSRTPERDAAGNPIGGLDEDYDYPDFNNMSLAAIRADGVVLVPSFHRPGYIQLTPSSDWTDMSNTPARGRRIILRPRIVDHSPNFPRPGAVEPLPPGVYDVDNMGLGRPDSVWVDAGFPVQQAPDGRKYKIMAAYCVIDMDGKLNLNVAGNLAYDKVDAAGTWVFPDGAGDGLPDSHADIAPGTTHGSGGIIPFPIDLSMGSGFGGANEVNLQVPFNPLYTGLVSGIDPREYHWLLEGRPAGVGSAAAPPLSVTVPGRWGEPYLIGTATPPRAGATYSGAGPVVAADDNTPGYLGAPRGNVMEGAPNSAGGVHRTPADFDGNGVLVTTPGGRPLYGPPGQARLGWGGVMIGWPAGLGHTTQPENLDDASELIPYTGQAMDALFSPHEAETLYRAEDVDWSSLLQWSGVAGTLARARLPMLAPSLFDLSNPLNRRRRFMLATESWDLIRYNQFPLQTFESTSTSAGNPGAGNGIFPFSATPAFRAILPEAIQLGRRLVLTPQFPPATPPPLLPDPYKIKFARELYLLMRAISPGATPERIKRIAQYCVNVVDFCDTEVGDDEIMTPFEFDVDPINGWNVDGNQTTSSGESERGVVWGTELPRLVINETLAYEDPMGTFNLWLELYNPSPYPVELNGPNHTYQLVVASRSPHLYPDPEEGEPTSAGTAVDFSTPGPGSSGGTLIPPGERMVVGPAGTIPVSLGGGPFGTPIRFVTSGLPAPGAGPGAGEFRVYVRRLANPYYGHDESVPFPDSSNPYITTDALDAFCYTAADIVPDILTMQVAARSFERRSLGVAYRLHDFGGPAPLPPPHSIGDDPNPLDDKAPYNSLAAVDLNGDGTPDPWPWLVFNDRPFASPMELLLVPAVSPEHMTTAFFYPTPAGLVPNPYTPDTAGQVNTNVLVTGQLPTAAEMTQPFREPGGDQYLYGHLLNFFRENSGAPAAPNPGYYRLFEYVEVPSRINGSGDPSVPQIPGDTAGRGRADRVPGKININTVYEQEVFQAALNNHPLALDATAAGWVNSQIPAYPGGVVPNVATRAEATDPGLPFGNLSSDLYRRMLLSIANGEPDATGTAESPARLFTLNDRPFRSFGLGASGVLIAASQKAPPPPSIQSTFLRGLIEAGASRVPVFEDDRGIRSGSTPYPPPGLGVPPNNLMDYPYFRWQVMQKMSNVFTTRSNVYAVWITLGYFEVLDENPARLGAGINAPPQLGSELNIETGQNVRHRAFFIVDRSRARGYLGPPRSSAELQDILSQVVIHSRIIE